MNLTVLDLSRNQISDISQLSSLTNLTELRLATNQISDVSALTGLTNLTGLFIGNNQVASITPLVQNSGLSSGDQVFVRNNCLDLSAGAQAAADVAALRGRGVTVDDLPQKDLSQPPCEGSPDPEPEPEPEPVLDCLPYSPLSCTEVTVSAPYNLTWSSDDGGLVDANGIGTGFTMVDPPSNRLSQDGPPSNPEIPGYEPGKLRVDTVSGTLTISSSKGVQFRDVNALVNGLGVGFDASAQTHTMTTTIVNPVFPAANQFQQAGLWFGPNEDNYIKLVLVNASGGGMATVQMVREVNGLTMPPADEVNLPAFALEPGSTVRLTMSTNPADGTVSGAYQIGEGEVVALPANLTAPPTFFTGVPLAEGVGPVSFGGIFATHRNADTPLNFSFGEFRIEPLN